MVVWILFLWISFGAKDNIAMYHDDIKVIESFATLEECREYILPPSDKMRFICLKIEKSIPERKGN